MDSISSEQNKKSFVSMEELSGILVIGYFKIPLFSGKISSLIAIKSSNEEYTEVLINIIFFS